MRDFTIFSYNCEGAVRNRDYLCKLLDDHSCDILCLQEIWTLDNTIHTLNNIHKDYSFMGISGIANTEILRGRPKGGVGILFRKNLSRHIKFLKIENRRVCGIIINMNNNFSCMILNIYLPCDNYVLIVLKVYLIRPQVIHFFVVDIITPVLNELMSIHDIYPIFLIGIIYLRLGIIIYPNLIIHM